MKEKKLTNAEKKSLLRLMQAREKRQRWKTEPIEYLEERLGIQRNRIDWSLLPEYKHHTWDGTPNPLKNMLDSLALNKWVAVEGATGVSKTFTAAAACLWFLENFENSLVITTAPKEQQLELHLWKEVQKLFPLFGRGELGKLRLRMKPPADTWQMIGFVAGVKASEAQSSATKAQGFHAEHILFVLEETPGINEAVINAFEMTSVAPHNLILALGNPDHQLDTLHRFAQRENVEHIVISGFDHPNVVLKNPNFIPGAQTEVGLQRLLEKFRSPENPLYLSRARGISPTQAVDSLIQLEWIRAAQCRGEGRPDTRQPGLPALGVDVANSLDGDKAAIAYGIGEELIEIESFPCPNSNKLGEQVWQMMLQRKITSEHVGVDGIGVGAGTVNKLEELGAKIINIISSEKAEEFYSREGAQMTEQFDNLRSQMWWQMRLDLQNPDSSLILPDDDELVADLISPKWTTRNGKIAVESKQEIKKRLGRSPNKGDSCIYWNWVRSERVSKPALQGLLYYSGEPGTEEQKSTASGRREERNHVYMAERRRRW